jgi:hypothetical protein
LLDYLIKLDCERYEYEALSKSYEDLRKFEVVFIEYHSEYEQIIKFKKKPSLLVKEENLVC